MTRWKNESAAKLGVANRKWKVKTLTDYMLSRLHLIFLGHATANEQQMLDNLERRFDLDHDACSDKEESDAEEEKPAARHLQCGGGTWWLGGCGDAAVPGRLDEGLEEEEEA